MANGQTVPATFTSSTNYKISPRLIIGSDAHYPQNPPEGNYYWFVVVDLVSLTVVVNEVQKATGAGTSTVPAAVKGHQGDPRYILFFATSSLPVGNLPQGDLYAFLMEAGAGCQLERVEQIAEQTGSNVVSFLAYALAATMNPSDGGGLEALIMNLDTSAIITMEFIHSGAEGGTYFPASICP